MSFAQSRNAISQEELLRGKTAALTGYSSTEKNQMQEFLSRHGCIHTALKGDTDLLFVKSLEAGDRTKIQAALEFGKPVYRDELVRWVERENQKKRLNSGDLKSINFTRFLIKPWDLKSDDDDDVDVDDIHKSGHGTTLANVSPSVLASSFPLSSTRMQGITTAPTSRPAPITAFQDSSDGRVKDTSKNTVLRHAVIGNWYSVKELEYDDLVQMPTKGLQMPIEQFCKLYGVTEGVEQALKSADILQANQLAFYSYKLYRKTSEQDGLNLSVGGAQILWEAVCAWKKGFESIQDALDW